MKIMRRFAFLILVALSMTLAGCEQYLARKLGGTAEHKLPAGAQLVAMTWKDTSLWVLYYEPATGRCVFEESGVIGIAEGKVIIPNCNPVALVGTIKPPVK